VIAGPPACNVCPETTYCDAEFAVMVLLPIVKGNKSGRSVIWLRAGFRGIVSGTVFVPPPFVTPTMISVFPAEV
jgi:hypothetical protein